MSQSLVCVNCHLIFSTKERAPLISEELSPRLLDYIGGIVRNQRACLVAAGAVPDHVHLVVSLGKELSVAAAVRLIKSNSSGWIHETYPQLQDFAWQVGYGAFSVSHSNMNRVTQYVGRQREHHRVRTFQDELREFLKRHNVEYDERYVWN